MLVLPPRRRGPLVLDASNSEFSELAAQLDRRGELDGCHRELYAKTVSQSEYAEQLGVFINACDKRLKELRRRTWGSMLAGLFSKKRQRMIAAVRAELSDAIDNKQAAEVEVEKLRRALRGVSAERAELADVDQRYNALAERLEESLRGSDPAACARLAELRGTFCGVSATISSIDNALKAGVEVLGATRLLAESLVKTGKHITHVRGRSAVGLAFQAAAFLANEAHKEKNVEPAKWLRYRLEQFEKSLGGIAWDRHSTTDVFVAQLVSPLVMLRAQLDDQFARDATGKPGISLRIAEQVEAVMQTLDRKRQERIEHLRCLQAEHRDLLAETSQAQPV